MNVAPLFSVLYIVGHYLLLYGRTNNVVKRRAALCFAACQSKKAQHHIAQGSTLGIECIY